MSLNRALKVSVVSVLACLAVACSTPDEENVDSDGASALSDATCKPRAQAAQDASVKSCKTANPLLDWTKCIAPADSAWAAYQTQIDEARRPVDDEIKSVTGACEAAVDQIPVDTLISDALPKITDFAREQTKRNTVQIATLREQRKMKCDEEAKDALADALGSDNAYLALLDQMAGKKLSYTGSVLSCSASGAVAYVKNAACTGLLAYQSEYATCRHTCQTLSDAACSPTDYTDEVLCGKLASTHGFSWRAGITCEETTKCERTSVCDAYDTLKEKADSLNESGSCDAGNGASGILVPVIGKDSKGHPTDVKTQCKSTD